MYRILLRDGNNVTSVESLGDSLQLIVMGSEWYYYGSLSVMILQQTCHPWGLENFKGSFERVISIWHVRLDG